LTSCYYISCVSLFTLQQLSLLINCITEIRKIGKELTSLYVCRFNKLLKKYGVGYVQGSLPAEEIGPSSRCESSRRGVRRSKSVVANRSAKQYVDTTRFFASSSTIDDATAVGRTPLPSTMRTTADSQTTSFECSSDVDEDVVTVDWASLRLVFVVLDVLLLVHRLTKLYVELDRMLLSSPDVDRFSTLSHVCADGISVLPVDGVDPAQTVISGSDLALPHFGNYVESTRRVSGDDDNDNENDGEPTKNSICVTSECFGSNSVSSKSTCQHATGSRWARRRRTRSPSDIVPRLVCLVVLLVALFYARTSTLSHGVLCLRNALPSLKDRLPSITSVIGRHFYEDVGIDSLSNDFRQLQAFVDFFNRGKSLAMKFRETVSISDLII